MNLHIHTIITEGAMGKNNVFKNFDFISYDNLRKRFQKILLDLLEKEIVKEEFRTLKNFIVFYKEKIPYKQRTKKNTYKILSVPFSSLLFLVFFFCVK